MGVYIGNGREDLMRQGDPSLANVMYPDKSASTAAYQRYLADSGLLPGGIDKVKASGKAPPKKPTALDNWQTGFDPTYLHAPTAAPAISTSVAQPVESSYLAGIDATPQSKPLKITVPYSSPAVSATTQMAAGTPQAPGSMTAVPIGGYVYLAGPDGKLILGDNGKPRNMGRAGLPNTNTVVGGMIKRGIEGATGQPYNPMSGIESVVAQGVNPPPVGRPPNRTGVTAYGDIYQNGVKTSVDPRFGNMTLAQRQQYADQEGQDRALMGAADPQRAIASVRNEANWYQTTDQSNLERHDYNAERAAAEARRNSYADGGIVEAVAGDAAPEASAGLDPSDPRVQVIADAEDAIEGHSDQPEAALRKFVDAFGQEALQNLAAHVKEGLTMRGKGRLVQGPGGPTDDAVPALVDGQQPVNLSNGEFIWPAAAVAAVGGGDHAKGAEKLKQMSDHLAGIDAGAPM